MVNITIFKSSEESYTQDDSSPRPSPSSSERSEEMADKRENVPPATFVQGLRIKTEPGKADDEENEEALTPNVQDNIERESPKRKLELKSEDSDGPLTPPKMSRTQDSHGSHPKKLHPDPMGLLVRAFPHHCRSVLELVLQGCGGNVVQAIECLLQNQSKRLPHLQMPLPFMPPMGPLPRDVHHGMSPLFPKPEMLAYPLHKHPSSPICHIPPPPPLLKPKPQMGFPFSVEAVLANSKRPSNAEAPNSEKPKLMQFCSNCGRKACAADNFCAYCGFRLF